jgi:hypothetical protein
MTGLVWEADFKLVSPSLSSCSYHLCLPRNLLAHTSDTYDYPFGEFSCIGHVFSDQEQHYTLYPFQSLWSSPVSQRFFAVLVGNVHNWRL